jgi:hypothetical protein
MAHMLPKTAHDGVGRSAVEDVYCGGYTQHCTLRVRAKGCVVGGVVVSFVAVGLGEATAGPCAGYVDPAVVLWVRGEGVVCVVTQ